ncbi:MAG: hypothetical protein P4L87_24290, partial [Formivibrio sp.]|nr:hypothetical protein [Formivibrio sp.]
ANAFIAKAIGVPPALNASYTLLDSMQTLWNAHAGNIVSGHNYTFADLIVNLGDNLSVADASADISAVNAFALAAAPSLASTAFTKNYTLTDTLSALANAPVLVTTNHVYHILDSAANLLAGVDVLSEATITNAGAVTLTGAGPHGAAGVLSVANVATLTVITSDDDWTYSLNDTAANLLNAQNIVISKAQAKTVIEIAGSVGTLTVSDYNKLVSITGINTWHSTVSDTAANLLSANPSVKGSIATTVLNNAASTLTVAEYNKLSIITSDDTWSSTVSDSAQNLLAADPSVHGSLGTIVNDDTSVNPLSLSFANVQKLQGITTDDSWHYNLTDTSADLGLGLSVSAAAASVAAAQAIVDGAQNSTSDHLVLNANYSLTDSVLALEGAGSLSVDHVINVVDSSVNLLALDANGQDIVAAAGTVKLNDQGPLNLSLRDVIKLQGITTDDSWQYNVTDSHVDLGSDLTVAAVTKALA